MTSARQPSYDPGTFRPLTWFDATPRFAGGEDDPRRYLERCLETIAAREPVVQAWVVLNEQGARAAADASVARWKAGRPLSPIDGMPIGIKDLIETKDMPTQMGCEAFAGNFPKRDSALVRALRDAGAVVLGKVVTTELGGAHPGPTTNPFDPACTPGGSSSGSGAAIGAGMIPVAIGTQVGGSVVRPASYCANWALKPTFGALNRGERQGYSHSVTGVHAGSAVDMWQTAWEIAQRAGGDPGCPGLYGPAVAPAPVRPQTLVVMETAGWAKLDAGSRAAFEQVLAALRGLGVGIVGRADSVLVESFEQSIAAAKEMNDAICAFEMRWTFANLAEQYPGKVSPATAKKLASGQKMTVDDYRRRLIERDDTRRRLAAVAPLGDALISLSSPGPATRSEPGSARPTGEATFNHPSSLLGAPVVTIPLLAVRGMPVGLQVMGQPHEDARVTAIARWIAQNVPAVKVG